MCSTTGAHLARICRAIEELASRSGQGAGERAGTSESAVAALAADLDGAAGSGETTPADGENAASGKRTADGENAADGSAGAADGTGAAEGDVASRLAEIWAMVADVDPELAKRLPGYLGITEEPQIWNITCK